MEYTTTLANGTDVTVYGTIEQIIAQLQVVNPAVLLSPDPVPDSHFRASDAGRDRPAYEYAFDPVAIECPSPLSEADVPEIKKGITYLRKLKGVITMRDQAVCSRVSCAWDSAILVCGHPNGDDVKIREWGVVADAAELVLQKCHAHRKVSGQVRDRGHMWYSVGHLKC